jgi:hypothetical protein
VADEAARLRRSRPGSAARRARMAELIHLQCGCVGAQTSRCVTENDNPQHPSCSGNCIDSEGNAHGCQLFGPLIGPPKDPALIRFRAR